MIRVETIPGGYRIVGTGPHGDHDYRDPGGPSVNETLELIVAGDLPEADERDVSFLVEDYWV